MSSTTSCGAYKGEAFPGYLPYTNVANDISKELPGVRIITIVREPIARAYSSYNYNYVRPALSILRRGQGFPPSSTSFHTIPKKESDAYYKDRHLFSFEEMVRAELSILKECLSPGGLGEAPMKKVKYAWAKSEYKRRNELGLPSLMDVERCYGGRMDRITPRAQWSELVKSNPEKIIDLPDLQLSEAVIGRGMYVLSLEWWYAAFATEDLHIVCLEELDNIAMNEITAFLGLPATNFTKEMELGRYNVAGHKGYNKLLTSDEMDDYDNSIERDNAEDVPLSNGLLQELEEFLKPYNERLFQLMGRRCKW